MLKSRLAKPLGLVAALLLSSASQASTPAAKDPAAKLGRVLDRVDFVEGFFVNRTGTYVYSIEKIQQKASVKMYRECGGNCRNFASDVISHLRDAAPVECRDGQESTLLKIGDEAMIIYRYSGWLIEFDGSCFLNEKSVERILEKSNWWFHLT